MDTVMSIVVATTNRGKLAEIRAILGALPVEVLSAAEALGDALPNITEDGETFEDNARIKARTVADISMMLTLADDSGLAVDALGGRPGVRSRRFAGEGATDAENNAELLRRLDEVEGDARTARFHAAIVVIDPWNDGAEIVASGTCEGSIARKASGTGGFGYDPLFIVEGGEATMAEISEAAKNEISHRAKALEELQPQLEKMIQGRIAQAESIMRGSYAPPPSGSPRKS